MLHGDKNRILSYVTETERNQRIVELKQQLEQIKNIHTINIKFMVEKENFEMQVLPTYKIEDIKLLILAKINTHLDVLRIIFNGIQYENHQTLEECGINDKAIIYCIFYLRGGSYDETNGKAGGYGLLKSSTFTVKPDMNSIEIDNMNTIKIDNMNTINVSSNPQSVEYNGKYTCEFVNFD